jgi:hypothetical protein
VPEPAAKTPDAPKSRTDQIIGRLIGDLHFDKPSREPRIGRGNLAALRRMDPVAYDVPAFWRLLAGATGGEMVSLRDEERWALIAQGMALMAPNHHDGTAIGEALQKINYAEGRLARLLAARGRQFRALVPRLCRHLAARQQPLNWYRFARLILTESLDEEKAEQIRLEIARAYFRAHAKAEAESNAA